MSSSVFFRFKSQKDPSRVAFDGTGISVFELKREIISISRLGDGTDFELVVTSEDGSEEYDDDTAIIPRSTTVIAKRMPAAKPGKGSAARYVSGKMPANAKNSHRRETRATQPPPTTKPNQSAAMDGGETEEDRIQAMFRMGADQWAQDQQQMANATPIHRGCPPKGKPQNLPNHPPPPGYICYRCGEKGHWIQACPTNNDPMFDGRPRVKRTTGIPRSFLKTVEKPTALANDGLVDDAKQPSGIMVNAEGEWVVAEPDKAAWDKFQAKAKVSAEAQQAAAHGNKELQERGLECSIDKRLFANPVKTPCCKKTFCHECITNALLDNDLRCPECSTEDVPIDNLLSDDDMVVKVRQYEDEVAARKPSKGDSTIMIKSESPEVSDDCNQSRTTPLPKSPKTENKSRKRAAESSPENDHKPIGPPSSAQQQISDVSTPTLKQPNLQQIYGSTQIPVSNGLTPEVNAMMMPNVNGFIGMPKTGVQGMNPMVNPMMMMMQQDPSFLNMNTNMWGVGFPQQGIGMSNGFRNGNMPNGGFGQPSMYSNNLASASMNMNGMSTNSIHNLNGMGPNGQVAGTFANQQRSGFGDRSGNNEESAYFRKPVNPHRHQARRNVNRPPDYREI